MKSALRIATLAAISLSIISGSAFAAGAIEGVVRGANGKAMASTDVKLEVSASKTAVQTVKTDNSGHYRFNNVANGSYKVTVMSGPKILAFFDNVKPASPTAKRVEFDIRPAAAGQPAKKAKHMVWVPSDTGSHMGGRWVEDDDTTGADHVEKRSGDLLRKMQNGSPAMPPGGG